MAQIYPQLQPFTLYAAGVNIGDTTMTLATFESIDGVQLTMADFGVKGYMTIEPGAGAQEEQISFTGVTANANGTTTITGISNVMMLSPFTETSGFTKQHSGGLIAIVAITSGILNQLVNGANDETITGIYTFTEPNVPRMNTSHSYIAGQELYLATKEYVDSVAIAGAPNASTTAKGLVQEATQAQFDARTATGSTGARTFVDPEKLRTVLMHDYAASVVGTDAYAITLTPAVLAYVTGDIYVFKADVANTGAATLNVNALGAKTILDKNGSTLLDGDITASSINVVVYDGTNMQLLSSTGSTPISQTGREVYAATATGNDTYVVTLSPVPGALYNGMAIKVKADVGNTGPATLNVNGLGAVDIVKGGSTPLVTGNVAANQVMDLVYNSTGPVWQLINPIPASTGLATGVVADLLTTASGNNDVTVTLTFTPRLIKLHYVLQGHTAASGTNVYQAVRGIAAYEGTTLKFNDQTAGLSTVTDDQMPALSATASIPNGTTAPTAGGPTGLSAIAITMTVNSVSSTGFVIRRATVQDDTALNARARIAYEAYE